MNWETYLAFGDSITVGARTYLGYPEYTAQILEQETQKNWHLINHSECGLTVAQLLKSIDKNFADLKEIKPSVCTLLIGTNDAKSNTDIMDFEVAYNLLLTKIRVITKIPTIKVIEIPVFPKGVTYPYTFEMNDRVTAYNSIIRNLSVKHGLKSYDLALSSEDFVDGIHLNLEGNRKVAIRISDFILNDRGL